LGRQAAAQLARPHGEPVTSCADRRGGIQPARLDAVTIAYDPEVEYRPAQAWVEGGFFEERYRGPEGYRRYVASTTEVFGAEVFFAYVGTLKDGRVIRLQEYYDYTEALAAVGLSA
jgi:hypothetical protein